MTFEVGNERINFSATYLVSGGIGIVDTSTGEYYIILVAKLPV